MNNKEVNITYNINNLKSLLGNSNELVIRNLIIGKSYSIEAAIIYMNGLVNNDRIDRDILNPLMFKVTEDLSGITNIENYILKKYIAVSNTHVETDIDKAVNAIKRGKTVVVIQDASSFIIVDTAGGTYRSITEPTNDISLMGPREGFIENLEVNISILRRKIKDKNLVTERITLGKRSQTDLVIMYIDDIVDKKFLQKIKDKINALDLDSIPTNNLVNQCIEEHPYSIFPQGIGSERPDVIQANLMEGRIALLLDGTPYVTTYPTVFFEFFQTWEDYLQRSLLASFIRILRIIAVFIVITFPAIYITLIKFNAEMIPVEFIEALITSRRGIALTPFMSLLAMQITIEFLREGGLRLPGKIGQTLSVVGGIIIGDAALRAKFVSSATLLVAGITTIASLVISNYQMSLSIRLLAYPMLILANWIGMLGIVIGWFFILSYLCSMENYGVPYFSIYKSDLKDIFIRAPIWKMNKRPEVIPHNDTVRQSDFRSEENE